MVRFEIKYSYNHVALGVKRYEACITFESYSPPSKTHVIDTDKSGAYLDKQRE